MAHHLLDYHGFVKGRPAGYTQVQGGKVMEAQDDPLGELTKRQQEVFWLIIEGLSNEEIADVLVISVKTVETYVTAIFLVYRVENKYQLVAKILRKFFAEYLRNLSLR